MVLKELCLVLSLLVFINAKPLEDLEDDGTCGYDACPAYDPDAINVHLICHSHDDVGWLKTVDQYYFQDVLSVIGSVVQALPQNKERRFVQVETAFFKKWWDQQTDDVRQKTRDLVSNGQLEIINAAWSMNDEAAVHYQSTIDQFTLGLRFMQDNLGTCARPTVGWQIDPFGHTKEHASISAQLGFDSLFFARLDYRDRGERHGRGASDFLWRASNNNLTNTDIFTSAFHDHYSAPGGFCFDISCGDDPIIDDEESPDYNLDRRVEDFARDIGGKVNAYPSNNVLITMGDDFRYQGAITTFMNLDLLIEGFNNHPQEIDGVPVKVYYSTPSCYAKAVNQYANDNDVLLENKTDDFMPYADGPNTYWTGYFTSRPASKRYERVSNNLLQVAKQLSAATGGSYNNSNINSLKEAVGIMQHHDAITGTEKQHVTNNYHLLLTRALENTISEADKVLTTLISGTDQDETFGLTTCLLTNVSSCPQSSSLRFTLVVYNPLSHTVSSPINVPVFADSWAIQAPSGDYLSYQVNPTIRDFSYVTDASPTPYNLVFLAEELPPQGFKVYRFANTNDGNEKVAEIPKAEEVKPFANIGYDDTNFEIDDNTGLLTAITMNGITVQVTQDYFYYTSKDSSGAYIFVPDGEVKRLKEEPISTTRIDGIIYQGVIQDFGESVKQIIKVYNHDRSFIEIDWVVGPLNTDEDGYKGKELISRFTTSLSSSETWYTDSNGREMQKRVRNHRDTYQYTNEQPVSGNYYPVNSKIVLKDESDQTEFAVITDRSQGGSSLTDGELELMVLRACHHDDGRGVGENLNEQQYGTGLVVRGQHYLVVGPANGNGQKSTAAIEREIALRALLNSWTFITDRDDIYSQLKTLEWSNLKTSLPEHVHVLTLEPWADNQIVIRLEHLLENGEDDNLAQDITVDLSDLFTTFTISELVETLLGANLPLEEHTPLHWPGIENVQKGSNILKRDVDDLQITLAPMQIRTFIATVTYNN